MNYFSVTDLTAGYGEKTVLKSISFSLQKGEIMGILGANGSGKTTLIKAICNILPHKGSCVLNSAHLESLSPREMAKICSYIPQRSGISIDMPVIDVVLMGFNPVLKVLENPSDQMRKKAKDALSLVGLVGFDKSNYQSLSEGQKQLVILARTLVQNSKLLLLDEPESSLDFRFRYNMMHLISDWAKKEQGAVIMTLHDPSLALNECDKLLVLSESTVKNIISPKTDSLEKIESALQEIYGPVTITRCTNYSGKELFVMLPEQEGIF